MRVWIIFFRGSIIIGGTNIPAGLMQTSIVIRAPLSVDVLARLLLSDARSFKDWEQNTAAGWESNSWCNFTNLAVETAKV